MPSMLRTHTQLQPAQWRLLIQLAAQGGTARNVDRWLKRSNADQGSLDDLRERRVVADDDAGAVVFTPDGRYLTEHTVQPCWQVLNMLASRGHRGSPIPDVLAYTQDVSIFDNLFRAGLTEMRRHNGEPVDHRPSWEEVSRLGNGRNWPGITVRITSAGLRYVE